MSNGHPINADFPSGEEDGLPDAASSPQPRKVAAADRLATGSLRSRVFQASALVTLGLLSTQVLRLVSNLILTRLLFPEHFGLMGMIHVVIQGVVMFSDVGIRGSIVQHSRGDQQAFIDTAWTIQVIRGFVLWAIIAFLAWPASAFYGEPALLWLIPAVGATSALAGLASTSQHTLSRHVRFGRQVTVQISGQALGIILMVVLALQWKSVWVLVFGAVFQEAYRAVGSYWLIPGYRNWFAWDRKAVWDICRFGLWVFLATGAQFIIGSADRLVLGKLWDAQMFGVFTIAFLLGDALLQLVRRFSGEVIFPAYAQLAGKGSREHLRNKATQLRSVLLMLVLPPLWFLAVMGDWVVGLLYTDIYAEAGWMLQILAIGGVGVAISMTMDRVPLAYGDSFRTMVVQYSRVVIMAAGIVMGVWVGGAPGVLWGVAVSRIVDYPVVAWSVSKYGAWMPSLDALAFGSSAIVIVMGLWLKS